MMSGTSLDGVDIVFVNISKNNNQYKYKLLNFSTIPYPNNWIKKLKNAVNLNGEALVQLNHEYGIYLGQKINSFIKKNKLENIDFVASHGHTIYHNPNGGYTLQIGNGPEIAALTKILFIGDFRTQDVALGGQGAPLVPIGDELFFKKFDYCLNLGGFANISFNKNKKRVAYDICPVNTILNYGANLANLPFDNQGKLAKSGKTNLNLLNELNQLSFYKKGGPKSLGIEWVNNRILPIIQKYNLSVPNLLCTLTEHIATQISNNLKNNATVLITGGGAFNSFLIKRIEMISDTKITIPKKEVINYKEAIIFALLGFLKMDNSVNCLKSVTGAKRDHSSGVIYRI
ncbi:MAG: anhydro-N-acetylmuramic acid kinase [Lutibacter sp.]